MSDVSTAVLNVSPPANLPLSVLLFNAAMNEEVPISDFAEKLGIGAISLRQFISGKTQRPRTKTIEAISDILGISQDDARRRAALTPGDAPQFSQWLKTQMSGRFSRARLTRDTGISDGALRNYLSGQTLPDSDQANHLAQALGVPSLDMAQVIVANQVMRNGGPVVLAEETPDDEEVAPPLTLSFIPEPRAEPPAEDHPVAPPAALAAAPATPLAPAFSPSATPRDEERLIHLWRQLHPQGRRATLTYIASLLAES